MVYVKRLRVALSVAGLISLGWIASAAFSHNDQPAAAPPSDQEKQMMEMMKQMAAPTAEHERLKSMVGDFAATVKAYDAPGQPPHESTGTMHGEMILGDRYLMQKF